MHLTSLLEMSIIDVLRRGMVTRLDIETEPAFAGLGPSHAAVGMNNQVNH
jgi:WD repeat-containing protein 19